MKEMYKISKFGIICIISLLCIGSITSCKKKLKEAKVTKENIENLLESSNMDTVKQTVTLYIDYSATKKELKPGKSNVYDAINPDLAQYCATIILVKGEDFETHSKIDETTLNNVLQTMRTDNDYNYTNIEMVFDKIIEKEEQAVFITDCEYIKDGKYQDEQGFFGRHLKSWLKKGYSVDIIIEPYLEGNNEKKRFYFFFSDDKLKVPMINNCMEKLESLLVDCPDSLVINKCYRFHMSNSDYFISSIYADNDKQKKSYYEFDSTKNIVTIKGDWDKIRSSVLCCDDHWKAKKEKKPHPIVCLQIEDGSRYSIEDVTISAKNISKSLATDGKKKDNEDFDDLSGCFKKETDTNGLVNIYIVPEKLLKKLYANKSGFKGNVIRVDIYGKFSKKKYNEDPFRWISSGKNNINSGNKAICVSESIGNALKDVEVVPSENRVLYTFYINLPSKE